MHLPLNDRPPRPQVPTRWLGAVVVGAPILMVLVITVAGRPVGAPGWTVLAGLVALTAATTLVLGCTPCATVAALSAPVAVVVLSTSSHDVPTAILALGAAAFGLRQRLTDPRTCPA